jgi:hypothetical protein
MFRRTPSSDRGLFASTENETYLHKQQQQQQQQQQHYSQAEGHNSHAVSQEILPSVSSGVSEHSHRRRWFTAHQPIEEGQAAPDSTSSQEVDDFHSASVDPSNPEDHDNKKKLPTNMWKAACQYMNSTRLMVLVVLCLQNSLFTVLRRYSQGVLQEVYSKVSEL